MPPPRKKLKTENLAAKGSVVSSNYQFWLMKSEPNSRIEKGSDVKFSIDDLEQCPNMTSSWEGVRNYRARNFMRDDMKIGHQVFFYHSNCVLPGIVGIAEVVRESYPDYTQFDKTSRYFDNSSKQDAPRWHMVDIKLVRKFNRIISLSELKTIHEEHKECNGVLKNMALFSRSRLSVQPVAKEEWEFILNLEKDA